MTRSPLSVAKEVLLASLRSQLAAVAGPAHAASEERLSTGCPPLNAILPRRGWERGALVEWLAEQPGSGAGTLAWLAAREAAREGGWIVVVDRQRQFYPPAAALWGVDCSQLLLVQPADAADEMWALDQALRSPAAAAVWAPLGRLDARQYRRLQLAAEQGRTLGLLIRPVRYRREPTWADVQLVVEPLPSLSRGEHDSSRSSRVRTLSHRRLRVTVARCPGGAREQACELRIDDFTAAITAEPGNTAEPMTGTSHETTARPPFSAVGFTTGYRRSPGAS